MTDSTAAALVDAAEARFAAEGIERASLRAVMRDAGTDPGAIHYHFRGRAALAEAVLERNLVPLNERRLELLSLIEASPGPITVESLVDALVRPDLEIAADLESRGRGRARLLGAIYLEPSAFVTEQVERRFGPVAARFHPHLIEAVPDVDAATLGWRVRWCLFGTLGALLLDPDATRDQTPVDMAALLVPPLAAAIAAPTGSTR